MGAFDSVIQSAAERLLEDEVLRSNLTDDEANVLFNWAIEWLEGRVSQSRDEAAARQAAQVEMARLRPALREINRQLAAGETPDVDTLLSHPSSATALATALAAAPDRKTLIRSLITQKIEAWSKQQ